MLWESSQQNILVLEQQESYNMKWLPIIEAKSLKEAKEQRDKKALWWGEWTDLFGRLGDIKIITNYLKIKEENKKK